MQSVLDIRSHATDLISRQFLLEPQYSPSSSTSDSSSDSDFSRCFSSKSSQSSVGSTDDFLIQPQNESLCRAFRQHQLPLQSVQQQSIQHPSQPSAAWSGKGLPPSERAHPRRCSGRTSLPPPLRRQSERKAQFVENLVDAATHMVEVIWPLSIPACSALTANAQPSNLPLRTFIEETLKRSKTSFSTLQVALYYLVLIKNRVPTFDFTMPQPRDSPEDRALQCGRRMFLAALILASKYLQDQNYSARAWSKITGLEVFEINTNEMAFLGAVNWNLHIRDPIFDRWQNILAKYTHPTLSSYWKRAVLALSASLDNLPPLALPSFSSLRQSSFGPDTRLLPSISLFTAGSPDYDPPLKSSSTPVAPPLVLEPAVLTRPPPAPISRALPTPQLQAMPTICQTPAAGLANTRSSMGSAMCLANNLASARSLVECGGISSQHTRLPFRPNIVNPVIDTSVCRSSSSSPDTPGSMISDHSSQSSRSSSVSSASGSSSYYSLSRLATHNASAMKVADTLDDTSVTILSSSPLTSDGLTQSPELLIEAYPTPAAEICDDVNVARYTRKRVRSPSDAKPDDLALQQKVRSLLRHSAQLTGEVERSMANDVIVRGPFASQAGLSFPYRGKPNAKRPCYVAGADVERDVWRPSGGPGMWRGFL